jgi:hypothetical protein
MNSPCNPRRPGAGFTLVELLIGIIASTFFIAAMADGIGLVGQQVEHIRSESDKGPTEAVALMTDMARYGWLVEQPSDTRLDIVDVEGGRTSFELDDGALVLTRPSGMSGVLLDGVASFSIEADTSRRLREATPLNDFRTWYEKLPQGTSSANLILETGLPVALGFSMPSEVPDEYDVLADVDEHAILGTLLTLDIPLAYVSAIPEDPNQPVAGDGVVSPGIGKNKKIDICHIPPGSPGNAHTLSVSESALEAHLEHGDVLGPCSALPPATQSAELLFTLYESRAPDDARPHGPALATMVLVADAIPSGSASWQLVQTVTGGSGVPTTPDGKVLMCHVPPGNPGNAHGITVSPNAVNAHLAHGDYYGSCGEHEGSEDVYALEIDTDPSVVSLDLSPLGVAIEPGRAYTLVMSMQSEGFVVMGGHPIGSADNSGIAQSASLNGALQPVAMSVPFRMEGMQRITQTAEFEPVSRVSVTVAMDSGRSASGSASVTSQVSVPSLWEGAVSGELEVLEQ